MNDVIKIVERLSHAAYEVASRNRNKSVGPDHLLYVVCSTEEGRREIEKRGGDYSDALSFLKNSFMMRSEETNVKAEYNTQFHLVVAEPLTQARANPEKIITMADVVNAIIERHTVCAVMATALVQARLVPDPMALHKGDSEKTDDQLNGQAGTHEGSAGEQEATPKRTETHIQESAEDPHLTAVKRAMRNLTTLANEKKLDPVLGRSDEVGRILDILQRRRKGNALLVGEPGVGKTAVVEGVAQLLALLTEPKALAARPVLEVSIPDLLAGTRFRGDFEQRIRHMMDIAKRLDAILFFDEAHMLIGAGSTGGGSIEASNILKPALARGEIQVIAATTSAEARSIRKDRALMRRFELVNIDEPNHAVALEIIQGAQETYGRHHEVSYADGVAQRCLDLSVAYMPEKRLPDKALDLLDAAAVVAVNDGESVVTEASVLIAATAMTGINAGLPTAEEIQIMRAFPDFMKDGVFGQDDAIDTLTKSVRASMTGVTNEGVAGKYLFNGPTGVGKTQTAKRMAQALGIPLVRIDMSEFMEKHSISGLIGSPPGYVGYDDDGVLISAAETHPRMVLLFDEAEKAHPQVFDILLQVLDAGRLTSPDGRTVSFRGAHIILTANIGAAAAEKNAIGFNRRTDEEVVVGEELNSTFRKEFLARIRHKIHFKKLDIDATFNLVQAEISRFTKTVLGRGMTVTVDENVSHFIADLCEKMDTTGRVVADLVEKHVIDAISDAIIESEGKTTFAVELCEGKVKVTA